MKRRRRPPAPRPSRRLKRNCHACRRRRPWAGGRTFGRDATIFVCGECWAEIEVPTLAERERLEQELADALARQLRQFVLLRCYQLLEQAPAGAT